MQIFTLAYHFIVVLLPPNRIVQGTFQMLMTMLFSATFLVLNLFTTSIVNVFHCYVDSVVVRLHSLQVSW